MKTRLIFSSNNGVTFPLLHEATDCIQILESDVVAELIPCKALYTAPPYWR